MLRNWQIVLATTITSTIFLCPPTDTLAQITPDNTLVNNSRVRKEGNINLIEGGTTAGKNLFHSLKEFGVPKSSEAYFNNRVDINNIITRVTGNSISNIDGLIRANGSANLFLINPRGIVFGKNAELDIGGSFIGSTANSLKFPDGNEFRAINPGNQILLSVNVPLGLQYGKNQTGNITNSGNLSVNDGKSITLISHSLENIGSLKTNGGQISIATIGSINNQGFASLGNSGGYGSRFAPLRRAKAHVALKRSTRKSRHG
ncbi:MAG: filamentous hemagglutinin N-terminal domain-containing protein, partial [Cyanobacteria bacterium P01_A01_bin.84]